MQTRFTTADVCAGSGLSTNAVNNLVRYGLAPEFTGGGHRRPRLWDTFGLATFCICGMLNRLGNEPLAAGRRAQAVRTHFYLEGKDFIPDGLEDEERPRAAALQARPRHTDRFDRWSELLLASEDASIADYLCSDRPGDFWMHITDRSYAFIGTPAVPTISQASNKVHASAPAFREIVGLGGQIAAIAFDEDAEPGSHAAAQLEINYEQERSRSAGLVAINLSRTVRTGFLALLTAPDTLQPSDIPEGPQS